MRVMSLPELPVATVSGEDWEEVYAKRLSSGMIRWPRLSMLLMAYLAWPNDEQRRNSFIGSCIVLFKEAVADTIPSESQALAPFGGLTAIAKVAFVRLLGEIMQLEGAWLEVAEIFQLIVDMTCDDHAILRRGPSISKAIDLCELENGIRGHSQLRQSWSRFRDVAHVLAAAAILDPYSMVPAKRARSDVDAPILAAITSAPDIVLAMAYSLQGLGLNPKSIHKEQPTLRPDNAWRIPSSYAPENLFFIFRDLSDDQLVFLSSRRVAKKAA